MENKLRQKRLIVTFVDFKKAYDIAYRRKGIAILGELTIDDKSLALI